MYRLPPPPPITAGEVGTRSVELLIKPSRRGPPSWAGGATGTGATDRGGGAARSSAPGTQGKITYPSSSSRRKFRLASRTSRVISRQQAAQQLVGEAYRREFSTCEPVSSRKRNLSVTLASAPNVKSMKGCSFSPMKWMFDAKDEVVSPEGNMTRARFTVLGVSTLSCSKQTKAC